MIRATKQAVLDRLRADTFLAATTFEGVVVTKPARYCTIYVNSGAREVSRFAGPQAAATFSFTVHSVGGTPDQSQLVAEHVLAQLVDWAPTIAGRSAGRFRHVASQPTQMDRDSVPALFWCVDIFDVTTEPV